MGRLVREGGVEAAAAWFRARGGTAEAYLREGFPRFQATYDFAAVRLGEGSSILDVGAHWLHQAFLFADAGHHLTCADVPDTFAAPFLDGQAEAMGARLICYRRLETGEGIVELPEGSVDMVLFSEIIEHITFNPIPMWQAIYRVLKPGGRILVTTPNSMYFRTLQRKLAALLDRCEYGVHVEEIFSVGTYGHHWKEYSIPELRHYFSALSPDFVVQTTALTPGCALQSEEADLAETLGDWRRSRPRVWSLRRPEMRSGGEVDLAGLIRRVARQGGAPTGGMIIAEVALPAKAAGIVISPPWIPL